MFVAIGFEKDFTIGSAIFGSYGFPWVELSVSISSISTTTNKRGQPAKSPTPQVEWKLDWELTRKTHQRKWLVGTFMFLTAITYEIPRIAQKFPYSVLGRLQFKLKFWSMYPLEVEISKVLKYLISWGLWVQLRIFEFDSARRRREIFALSKAKTL